jgi:hypothetical protein
MVKLRQYIADHKVGICIIVIILVSLAFALRVWRLGWGWTGFFQDTTQTITTGKITTEIHPRTFWDVLELAIIPALIALIVLYLNSAQRQTELEIESRRADREQAFAERMQRQAMLDVYFDRMKDLLLKEGLRESRKGAEVRDFARTYTLAVLRSFDPMQKGQVLQFLCESGLINRDNPIVDLDGANLSEAYWYVSRHVVVIGPDGSGLIGWGPDLSKTNLSGVSLFKAELPGADANLAQVNLRRADLSKAMLNGAMLIQANLRGADLTRAMFHRANLTGAIVDLKQIEPFQLSDDTIMPDGTTLKEWVERKAKETV